MSKVTSMGFTFTARSLRLPKISRATLQRIREQYLAMKTSMDAFETQLQDMAAAAKIGPGVLGRLKRQIEGHSARWAAKDDRAPAATQQRPASPFGYIVDVVASHPGPKGGSTLLIPRNAETVEAAIERLASSTTWSRGQLRYVATVLEKSGEFDYWKIPKLIEWVVRSQSAGMPVDPHALVQIVHAYRFNPHKPA